MAERMECSRKVVRPDDFRKPGDTDLRRLQRFLDAIGNGVDGELDADYVVPSQLVLSSKLNFTLNGNGHRIKLADGAATGWGALRCISYSVATSGSSTFIVTAIGTGGSRRKTRPM